MDELLEQFLIEAPEQVEQAAADLLTLEGNPADIAAIDSAFRAVHTLKGSVALFDFAPMGKILHAAEGLLEDVRKQKVVASKPIITALLGCITICESWLRTIARTERLPHEAAAEAARLTTAIDDSRHGEEPAPLREDWLRAFLARETSKTPSIVSDAVVAARYVPGADSFFRGEDPVARMRSVPGLLALDIGEAAPRRPETTDPYECNLIFHFLSTASADAVRHAFGPEVHVEIVDLEAGKPALTEPGVSGIASPAASRTIRIDQSRVDLLSDLIGELVVAKNELGHLAGLASGQDIQRALSANQASINRLTGDMHRAVMSLRMLPLSRTFRRFPRLVRDLADRLGKNVSLSIQGGDLEADKAVVDGLYDPLLHVLRNAVDHGIESREQRERAGKPPEGRIAVAASRAGEEIVVSISDDGEGINTARVRERAGGMGLRSVAELEGMSDADVLELVFEAGFTTSSAVSDVSGRGVGMDAVRTALQSLGGRASLESIPGHSTTVRLTVPQTVIITTVLVVAVDGERFGVPLDAIVETARIARGRIRQIRSGAAFVLRDRTIPLLRLSEMLGLRDASPPGVQCNVLIARIGPELIGLEIEGVAERFDVLVRPMTGLLAGIPGALGSALLGDGRVLMILNLQELVNDHTGRGPRHSPEGGMRA